MEWPRQMKSKHRIRRDNQITTANDRLETLKGQQAVKESGFCEEIDRLVLA